MKFIAIAILIISTCSSGQKKQVSPTEFIFMNKNGDFSIFQNWKIYPREGKGDVLVCDYYKEDEVNKRYLVFKNNSGEFLYKNIYPVMDTVSHSLEKGNYTNERIDLELINTFNALNINKLTYVSNLNLYLFDLQETSVIYSEKDINLTDLKQYEKYVKVDSNWFYYEVKR
jgi:hypothetical protein